MRDAMMQGLFKLAACDKNVILITADLGYGVFEEFSSNYPDQYINVGVAEQNMLGVASGLALEGKIIYAYSIGNFPTLRCLEQIRNDACYHNLNINIISMGGGFSYGGLGMSHHATEDISIMRAIPGITVIAPCNSWEAENAVIELSRSDGVGYLRIDKTKVEDVNNDNKYKIGKANILRNGVDVAIIATGGIVIEALRAAEFLAEKDVECMVISMHTVKPIDISVIISACEKTQFIVTLEENTIMGGLGSAISEVIIDNNLRPGKVVRMGLKDRFVSTVGSQDFLRNKAGLSSADIVELIQSEL